MGIPSEISAQIEPIYHGVYLLAVCDLTQLQWQQTRNRLGARIRLFESLRSITCYQVSPSWNDLLSGPPDHSPRVPASRPGSQRHSLNSNRRHYRRQIRNNQNQI
ncbi:MAG: hypothetical protein OXG56_00715 [Gammaproteobacteria bacterium]|nr:hypothetical protein [Gammaproteobacteria bacterium]